MNVGVRKARERQLPVDMTPMIDIVFQLLIFFLTTAQLAQVSRAEMDLPTEAGEQEETAAEAGLIVNVMADGSIVIATETIGLDAFELMAAELVVEAGDEIAALRPLVRADRNAPTAALNRVLLSLQRAGVPAVRIATAPGS
jgi:biopolymer transport protein ExbD